MDEKIKEKYNDWNLKKQKIQFSELTEVLYFNVGEVWWCSLGINIGTETFGKGKNFYRPVLIIKKLSNELCIALPLTSKKKIGTWFMNVILQNKEQCIMLYQIRTIHKKRFYLKIGQLGDRELMIVKEKLKILLEFPLNNHSVETEIEGYNPKSNISIGEENNSVKSDNVE